MAHVEALNRFPLTGAQAEVLEDAYVGSGGIVGDRILVLRDTNLDPTQEHNRINQKRHRGLAQVAAKGQFNGKHDTVSITIPGDYRAMNIFIRQPEAATCYVNEFDDLTPLVDCGDTPAAQFSTYLGKPGIRLGQKMPDWLAPTPEEAANRKVAPIHIVTAATVRMLQHMGGTEEYGQERLRANMIVEADEPAFAELGWIGGLIVVENVPYYVDRATPRCLITGIDQETGENKKDIPKLFRDLPTIDGEAMIGVYAHPVLQPDVVGYISLGSEVSIHPA